MRLDIIWDYRILPDKVQGVPTEIKFGVRVPTEFVMPDLSIVPETVEVKGNLMMPGPARKSLQGTNIMSSQIRHIQLAQQNGLLNKDDKNGGDTPWGTWPSDTPAYQLQYLPLIKKQLFSRKQ
jgi:hypothetical protein